MPAVSVEQQGRGGGGRPIRGADGWSGLFWAAFMQSRNAMVVLDASRLHVEVNGAYLRLIGRRRADVIGRPAWQVVAGSPALTAEEWVQRLALREFTGEVSMLRDDGTTVAVQWGATVEVLTGRRYVLLAALSTARWGAHFRPEPAQPIEATPLTPRELDIVKLMTLGQSGPEIADELGIAHETVRTHVRNAMTKLGARSRAQLVAKAIGDGHALT
jgi:PAS domain S-box-containing protein